MKKATKVYEHIFIYLAGIHTAQGDMMALFALDQYSDYVFEPIIEAQKHTDAELKVVLRKLFKLILKKYNPHIHPKSISFITNLPPEIESIAYSSISKQHKIIYAPLETKEALMPFVNSAF